MKLRWNNVRPDSTLEGIKAKPTASIWGPGAGSQASSLHFRSKDKNVLDIPSYRSGVSTSLRRLFARAPRSMSEIGMLRQQSTSGRPFNKSPAVTIKQLCPHAAFMKYACVEQPGCPKFDRKPGFWGCFLQEVARSSTHMAWSKRLLAFALFAQSWSPPNPLFAQTPVPVWAELVHRLDASKVKVGDPILAELALAWEGSG